MASISSSSSFGLSQVPGDPSFRNSAVNAVAVIPLLSDNDKDGKVASTKSADSFGDLLKALQRYAGNATTSDELLLVVPNSSLTRPGDWSYSDTPLKSFHWQHGCQRLHIFDGRPEYSRKAYDRLMNHMVTRDWIDLSPSRRTAAVIGVLNMHDCRTIDDLHRAEEELFKWAERFATPPYEVTAHGRSADRDQPVQRLFVYDSFDEECQKIDLSKSSMGTSILAFPPTDDAHAQMMDLHLNVVVNDLAVAVFRDLENKIRESDMISSSNSRQPSPSLARMKLTRRLSSSEEPAQSAPTLTVSSMAGLVSPTSKLAIESPTSSTDDTDASTFVSASSETLVAASDKPPIKPSSASTPLLLTPLDDYWEPSELSGRDVDAIRNRDTGRREKFAADLSLLAGSPLDAYARYLKAAEICKSGTLDPLWYAASLEGCAAAHIAMAEAGGYSIDDYLENNFQLPDEFMAATKTSTKEEKRQERSSTKQTMPEVVFALCEEALNIVNRHSKLAGYHAELLLKLAWYASDSAESHLRCRWGEGYGCYAGEQGDVPRWERTSVYKLKFDENKLRDGDENSIVSQTLQRTRKVCELLQQAATLGAIDPPTRVDAATQGVVLCLHGVKPTQWANVSKELVVLPRKSAFFATIAAEAMSSASSKKAGDLWLLATQLYQRNGGPAYGWGTLRATCLSALSVKGNPTLCLEAAEQLLSLLDELEPNVAEKAAMAQAKQEEGPLPTAEDLEGSDFSDAELALASTGKGDQEVSEAITTTANLFAKQVRETFNQMKATSSFLAQQSKWAYDDPIAPCIAPLGGASPLAASLTTLRCVWSSSDLNQCTTAQSQCMNRISVLKRALATSSSKPVEFPTIYSDGREPTAPLFIVSASATKPEAHLDLEKVDKNSKLKDSGAMATFFNPFESKRRAGEAKNITLVAEEEDRSISVEFGNRLTVPLEISRCRLEFNGRDTSKVMSTSISFVIPPKSTTTVSLPFTVLARSELCGEDQLEGYDFVVSGLDVTCLGRTFSLPIKPDKEGLKVSSRCGFPPSASEYPHKALNRSVVESDAGMTFPIQVYPSQPSMQLVLADSLSPVESLSLELADGELYTSPLLSLKCHAGPTGRGRVEQLEVYLSGLPGLNKKLFDSSAPAESESKEEFVGDLFEKELSTPLRARILAENLSLDGINASQNQGKPASSTLRIQIAAAHNMARRLKKDTKVQLRFRYRGRSYETTQVWRNYEVGVHVKLMKGPRITTVSFQPEILPDCFFGEFCEKLKFKISGGGLDSDGLTRVKPETKLTMGVGQYASVNVCSDKMGLLLTVSNETRSKILLSKKDGPISQFPSHQIDEVLVRPRVSAKIPIFLTRLKVMDEGRAVSDLVDDLVSSAKFAWRSLDGNGEEASGQVRIPPACLRELVGKHPSFVSKLCESPVSIKLSVNQSDASTSTRKAALGSPGSQVGVEIGVASWVPLDESKKCEVTMELFCVRQKEASGEANASKDHVWAGKVRHKANLAATSLEHKARIIFCIPGNYIVSACARITHEHAGKGVEEIWWAPVAQRVVVERGENPAL